LEQLDCQEAQAIEASQLETTIAKKHKQEMHHNFDGLLRKLETTTLLGSTSKKCITTLVVF
jgi:hypothetical protein